MSVILCVENVAKLALYTRQTYEGLGLVGLGR